MATNDDFEALLAAHHTLDLECRDRRGRMFVADWYCEHPFVDEFFGPTELTANQLMVYYFQNDFDDIHAEIIDFHRARDGVQFSNDEIFVTAGMTALLTAQMMMLKQNGVQRIYCIRPLYYTYYYLAQTLGIELVPVNADPLNVDSLRLRLPQEAGAWLVICDPIWFMGRPIADGYIEAIVDWQQRYGGMVIVDGAFQYMRWSGDRSAEATARLDPTRTFRALCPTKSLAVHGVRFSYCLLPAAWREQFRYAYANTAGSGCVFDHKAGLAIMRTLNSPMSNSRLLNLVAERYRVLTQTRAVTDPLDAIATYFCFVQVNRDPESLITMDQVFFDTRCYPGLTRFNLLLPAADLNRFLDTPACVGRQNSEDEWAIPA